MSCVYTVTPEINNILGSSRRAPTSNYVPNDRNDPEPKKSLWSRIKSGVKKALEYIKDTIVPIVTATATLLNAWANYRRYAGNAGSAACHA